MGAVETKDALTFVGKTPIIYRTPGLLVLEPLTDTMCPHCMDETPEAGRTANAGRREKCKVCNTEFKVVECDAEYAQVARAIVEDAKGGPVEVEFAKDTDSMVELSKKYGPTIGVQAIAFLKSKWKDMRLVKQWLRRNGYMAKIAKAARMYTVFPQLPGSWMLKGTLKMVGFGSGVKAVIGRINPSFQGQEPQEKDLDGPAMRLPAIENGRLHP
jgi:hypothetical protein